MLQTHDLPESLHVLHKRNSLSYVPFSVLGMDPTHPTHVLQGPLHTLSYPFPSMPLLYTSWHNDQSEVLSAFHTCTCVSMISRRVLQLYVVSLLVALQSPLRFLFISIYVPILSDSELGFWSFKVGFSVLFSRKARIEYANCPPKL